MRLTTKEHNKAKEELLYLVRMTGTIRTSDLIGTPNFHGERTLTPRQVLSLLHELETEGKVVSKLAGQGLRTFYTWSPCGTHVGCSDKINPRGLPGVTDHPVPALTKLTQNRASSKAVSLPIGWAEDKCRVCDQHLGYGQPDFHLGYCEAHYPQQPDETQRAATS